MLFVRRTRTRPQDAREDQVAAYLRELVASGKCHGTIRTHRAALVFVFQNTLQREWGLFKKRSALRGDFGCRTHPTMRIAAA